jgi:hypothetical protein
VFFLSFRGLSSQTVAVSKEEALYQEAFSVWRSNKRIKSRRNKVSLTGSRKID